MRLTLQSKILLLVAGTASAFAFVVLVSLAYLTNRQIDQTIRADVRADGGLLSVLLSERSKALQDQALLLSRQSAVMMLITSDDPVTYADSAKSYQKLMHADAVAITNRDGRSGASDVPPSAVPTAETPGIQAAMNGGVWSGVVVHDGRLMLSVSAPVYIGRQVWGAFSAYRAIDSSTAKELRAALGTDVAFVYRDKVVAASIALPNSLSLSHTDEQSVTLSGKRYIALYAPLPNTDTAAGMGFVTLWRYDEATAPYERPRIAFFVVSILTLLIALMAGTMLGRNLTQPLASVVQAAHVLRQGRWPERFDVQRHDEIGLLETVFNDMTAAMRASQERLLALLHIDPLTELENHRSFQERLTHEARRCAKSGELLSLIIIDIDHFQHYNQQHGHAGGDETLKRIACAIEPLLPGVAVFARYGGEEFAVLLPQHDLAQAEALAEELRAAVSSLSFDRGNGQTLSVSAGCAEFGMHTSEPEGLVLAVELALSRAKQLGRNQVCRFDTVPGADQSADPYQLYRFLKDESLATIQALAAAVDAKDAYTRGHSQSVARYASELAKYIRLPQDEIDLIHTAGTLHDVGKIGVPDAILKKPGRLDEDERRVMETHPVLGEVIIRKAPALAPILAAVRHHHERWDGRGYPDNLAGDEIPRIARLLAVADTFDAMTSDRPYRSGLPTDVALGEIEKKAGTQFEPELAEAFVTMMRERTRLSKAA